MNAAAIAILLILRLHDAPGRDRRMVTELHAFPVRFIESFKLRGC
jgi:hypothetical protein